MWTLLYLHDGYNCFNSRYGVSFFTLKEAKEYAYKYIKRMTGYDRENFRCLKICKGSVIEMVNI